MTEHENRSAVSAALCVVLRNDEEQYAIWPAARRVPAGWHRIAAPASAARCRSLVDDLWTDMRLLSVRAERHPTRSGSGTVPEMVRGQTRRKPSALAVLSDEGRLSYAELTDRVDRLAHELRQSGVAPESVVTVCLDRKPELVVALLAVLSSGGAFLPLDPATPRRRMAELMAKTRSRHVVSARLGAHWRSSVSAPSYATPSTLSTRVAISAAACAPARPSSAAAVAECTVTASAERSTSASARARASRLPSTQSASASA